MANIVSLHTIKLYYRCDWRGCTQFLEWIRDDPPNYDDLYQFIIGNGWTYEGPEEHYCESCSEFHQRILVQDIIIDKEIDRYESLLWD